MARRRPNPIQNISGLSQGPAQPFGGMLIVGHRSVYDRRRSTMNEQAVQERRGRGLYIAGVALFSVLVLLILVLWLYHPPCDAWLEPGPRLTRSTKEGND